jgi:hypothetical protein
MKNATLIKSRLFRGFRQSFFFLLFSLVALIARSQTTYYVNDLSNVGDVYTTGTGSNLNPGTAALPFLTINYAISAAAPNDIIMVDAGTYAEWVNINKAIDLRGAKYGIDARTRNKAAGESILDGSTLPLTGPVYDAIMIANAVSGVVIDGFEIAHYGGSGLNGDGNAISSYCMGGSTTGASNVVIHNNYIHDVAYNGILVGSENFSGSSMVIQTGFDIRYNKISGYQYAGVELTNTSTSQVRDNSIDAPVLLFNDPGDAGVGIEIAARSRAQAATVTTVTVSGNNITGSFPAGSRAGINILSRAYMSGSDAELSGVVIDSNTVSGATQVRAAVLAVAEARDAGPAEINDLTVRNNTLTGNSNGMTVQDYLNGGTTATHSNVSVFGNFMTNSVSNGFFVESSTSALGISLNDNSITGNAGYAILNNGTDSLNATCNWYDTTDRNAIASIIGGNVKYLPYLLVGTDYQPLVAGFQPVPGTCGYLAQPFYTGMLFASTSSSTVSTATVTLSATVKDFCAIDGDYCPGADITTALIRFVNRDLPTTDPGYYLTGWLPVGLVQVGNTLVGSATADVVFNVGSSDAKQYTVGILVGGAYYRNRSEDDAIVTVAKPLSSFASGGGLIILTNSFGIKAGDSATRTHFGFNAKYNSRMTNLQGTANLIFHRTETDGMHTYQVKGINMTSLSVVGATASSPARATLSCKANIRDITDPLLPVSLDGNATLQMTMTDMGEPGKNDAISITVLNKSGGLWFTSDWNGVKAVEQLLAGGNLKVHPSAITTGTVSTTLNLTSGASGNTTNFGQSLTLTASVIESNIARPSGSILFYDGTTLLGYASVNSLGKASLTTNSLSVGVHTLSAYYSGDNKFKSSSSNGITHTVLLALWSGVEPTDITKEPNSLHVLVFNNPSRDQFAVEIHEPMLQTPATIRVMTANGQWIETIGSIQAGERVTFGRNYAPGMYMVEVESGNNKKIVRLIKMN